MCREVLAEHAVHGSSTQHCGQAAWLLSVRAGKEGDGLNCRVMWCLEVKDKEFEPNESKGKE